MAGSHKESKLSIRNLVNALPEGMILFPLDGRVEDTLNKIPLLSKNATFAEPSISKHRGSVEIYNSGQNIIPNPSFKGYSTNSSIGWDNTLNGIYVANSWWSGYNSGVQNPTVGFHGHINIDRFGYPVWEQIDKNSQFSDQTYNLKHRWMACHNYLGSIDKLGWGEGTKVTISFDLMVEHIDKRIQGGIYHEKDTTDINGVTTVSSVFDGAYFYFYCDKPFQWERKEATFTVTDADWKLPDARAWLYLYGHYSNNGVEATSWIKDVQIETNEFATPLMDGSRTIGQLKYDISSLGMQDAGCVSVWVYISSYLASNPTGNKHLINLNPQSTDTVRLFFASGSLTIGSGGTWEQQITSTTASGLGSGTWNQFVFQWDKNNLPSGNKRELYVNGKLVASSTTTTIIPLQQLTQLTVGHHNTEEQYVSNTRFEQLAIHPSKGFSADEIRSWYESDAPFYDYRDEIFFKGV